MYPRIGFVVFVTLAWSRIGLAQNMPPDDALWTAIEALARSTPASEPFEARFSVELTRRQALLEKTQSYLRIYPGGRRRDEAIALELETLFEIASLRGDYEPLAARIRALDAAPPSEAAKAEAAWWQIHCDRARATATRPAANSPETGDRDVLAAYRKYVEQFPRSRNALRALGRLSDDALSQGDLRGAERWVSRMSAEFPENAMAEGAAARLRLAGSIGKPFAVKLRSIDDVEINTANFAGDVILICVWDSTQPASRNLAREIDAFVAAGSGRRALGVCIADTADATRRATRSLGIAWPQCNDGLGRAGEFARSWGIRETPTIMVIDRRGCLIGCGDARSWRALADRSVAPDPTGGPPKG
jgi:hypothetical protein